MRRCLTSLILVAVAGTLIAAPAFASAQRTTVKLRISGGHATDSRDNGRPVVLIAAALKVPAQVFRDAFAKVTPATGGNEPDPAQVQRNKAALLAALAPYGVTNERLDAVSNYYRYMEASGETWRHAPATARATLRNGKVVSVRVLTGGAGYSSKPRVTVPGHPGVVIRVTLSHGTDLSTNGGVKTLRLATS